MTHEKSIHLESKPLLSQDIIEQDQALQSYLAEMVSDNRKDEAVRQKMAKARHSYRIKYLKEKEKRAESDTEKSKVWMCKK